MTEWLAHGWNGPTAEAQDQLKQVEADEPKKPIHERRNDDFTKWLEEISPDHDGHTWRQVQEAMKWPQVHRKLKERNPKLWAKNFYEWCTKQQIIKKERGRKKGPLTKYRQEKPHK